MTSPRLHRLIATQPALDKFLASKGWTAGVDATVAVANVGALNDIGAKALTRRGMLDRVMRREAIERWENEGGDLPADDTTKVSMSGCTKG